MTCINPHEYCYRGCTDNCPYYATAHLPLPPAEGAEEILCERDDAEDFLSTKDIWNHPRISDRTDMESYEVADLMAEFAQSFATLHAQRLAEKMVEERLTALISEGYYPKDMVRWTFNQRFMACGHTGFDASILELDLEYWNEHIKGKENEQ